MEFLQKYGSRVTAEDKFVGSAQVSAVAEESTASSNDYSTKTVSSATQVMTATLAILATISAGCIG
jgi:hypothetical protein